MSINLSIYMAPNYHKYLSAAQSFLYIALRHPCEVGKWNYPPFTEAQRDHGFFFTSQKRGVITVR